MFLPIKLMIHQKVNPVAMVDRPPVSFSRRPVRVLACNEAQRGSIRCPQHKKTEHFRGYCGIVQGIQLISGGYDATLQHLARHLVAGHSGIAT
jgi:hypothetical protein